MSIRGCLVWLFLALAILGAGPAVAGGMTPAAAPLGPPISDLLRLDVNSVNDPEDDAVVLYRGVEVRWLPDGRLARRVRLVQRLLRDEAVTENGDPRVAYDTTSQVLEIHQCRTYMRDGREVAARPRAFNLVTPERVASCPDRATTQEMVISYLGVELGCLTELDYTLTDRSPYRPWVEGMEALGSRYPVRQAELKVESPPGLPWQAQAVGAPGTVQFEENRSGGAHRWWGGPLPACPDEGGLVQWERVPFVVYSSCPSWDSLVSWLKTRLREQASPDSAIRRWTREPMVSHRPPLDVSDRLEQVAWLLRERTSACDDPALDWWLPVRPAARTFSTSCGNLPDRAALGLACLGAQGLEAGMALRPAFSHLVHEVPALSQFDDLWLRSGPVSLSVSQGTVLSRPDPGWAEELLVERDGRAGFLPLPARRGAGFLSLQLSQDDAGAVNGQGVLRLSGAFSPERELADVKGFLENIIAGYTKHGTLGSYRVRALARDTCDLVFAFAGTALGDSLGGGRRLLRLPAAPGMLEAMLPSGVNLRRAARVEPLLLRALGEEEVHLRLELGSRSRAFILPQSEHLSGAGMTLQQVVRRDGGAILLDRTFRANVRTIRPEDYPAFRALWGSRIEDSMNSIFMEPAVPSR